MCVSAIALLRLSAVLIVSGLCGKREDGCGQPRQAFSHQLPGLPNAAAERLKLLCAASKRARVEQGGGDQASAGGDLLLAAGPL